MSMKEKSSKVKLSSIDYFKLISKICVMSCMCSIPYLELQATNVTSQKALDASVNFSSVEHLLDSEQQQLTIQGRIVDSMNEPLIGASIRVKNSPNIGTISDINGEFKLKDVPKGSILEISFIGYKTQEIQANSQSSMTIELKEDTESLDEVVVIGYGVQKKKLVTGANIQVKGEELQKRNSLNAFDALVGQSPGVFISQSSGQPGESFKVNIRGLGTVGDATPLYIVDGMQSSDISQINPSDIESIDILKDAASSAIYGARAANGVVLITTKKGTPGKAVISYDGFVGFQTIPNMVEMLDAQEYAMIQNEAAINSGRPAYDWDKEFGINLANIGKGTNWLDEIVEKNALTQNHVLAVNGGSNTSVYSLSLSLSSREGVIGGSKYSNSERYTFRANSEHKLHKDIIKIGQHASYMYWTKRGVSTGNQFNNTIHSAMQSTPFLPVYDGEGNYHQALSWWPEESNPVGSLHYKNQNLQTNNKFLGDIYIEVQPIKNLKWKSSFGVDISNYTTRSYLPIYTLSTSDKNTVDTVNQGFGKSWDWSWENTVNYSFDIKKHSVNALLGMQARRSGGESMDGNKALLSYTDFDHAWISNATSTDISQIGVNGAPYDIDNLLSYFGRITWNYNETYMATVTMRADASSRFGHNNRWGYFPSASAGWVVTNEPFMEGTKDWLDFFKLRVSWGQNGNQNISSYAYLATIQFDANYEFGPSDNINPTFTGSNQNRTPNPDIKWETSEQFDIGFDARFLGGRLNAAFDYYTKTTKDWLLQVPVAAALGQASNPYINGGSIRNSGIELGLSWNDHISDLQYSVNANIAYNKNEVLDIPNSEGIIHGEQDVLFKGMQEMYRAQEGYPIGYFWGLDMAGIFQTEEEIQNYKNSEGKVIQPGAKPGDVKFVDHDGNGTIDMGDNVDLGNPYPDITMGLSLSLSYKGADFYLSSNGSFGHQIAQAYRAIDRFQYNYPTSILGRWTGPNTSNSIPRVTQGDEENGNWLYLSQLYVKNADFWRINNITVGYDFNRLIPHSPLGQLRLYATVQNVLTITGYDGMDPDVGYAGKGWASGIDIGYYPHPRTFLFGVNVKF